MTDILHEDCIMYCLGLISFEEIGYVYDKQLGWHYIADVADIREEINHCIKELQNK